MKKSPTKKDYENNLNARRIINAKENNIKQVINCSTLS